MQHKNSSSKDTKTDRKHETQRYEVALLCCNPVSGGNMLSLTSPPQTFIQNNSLMIPLLSQQYLIFNQHGKSMLVYAELISLDIPSLSSEKNNKMSKTRWRFSDCGNRGACPSINVVESAPLYSVFCVRLTKLRSSCIWKAENDSALVYTQLLLALIPSVSHQEKSLMP